MNADAAARPHREGGERSIDLTRTTPPAPAFLADAVRTALSEIGSEAGLDQLIRSHRFAGTSDDTVAAAAWLSLRLGFPPEPNRIIVTNGAQNAVFLLLKSLVSQGKILLTENLTYHSARLIADTLGMELRGVAMDQHGLAPEAFEDVCRDGRVAALYCMPTLQNPTAVIMPSGRRRAVADIARRYSVAIIEDDVYGLLPYEAPPPLAAIAPDVTWYVTGFGKCVAAGLRLGYALAPTAAGASAIIDRFRIMSTWFPAPLQAALAIRWISDGTAARILAAVRAEAARRRALGLQILCDAKHPPRDNALHVWLELSEQWKPKEFVEAASRRGVKIRSGEFFTVETRFVPRAVRVCTGGVHDGDLIAGLEIVRDLIDHPCFFPASSGDTGARRIYGRGM